MSGASPSSPSIRERFALHTLQLGAIAVVLVALPYKAFDLDRYFVPKELALHACAVFAALILLGGVARLTLGKVDMLVAAFVVGGAISAVFATNMWAAERALAISLSGALLFWTASALRRAGLAGPLLVALALAIVLGAATSLAQAYGVSSDYFSLNRAPGGTFGNRNFVAHLCAVGVPVVALAAVTARNALVRLLAGVGMTVVVVALVLSRSRAAWLAVIVVVALCGLCALMTRKRWSEPRTTRRIVVLGAMAAAGVVVAIVLPNRLEWKSDSPYLDSAAGLVNYKEGSGHGRLIQYTNSLHMAESRPVFGVGPGNWPVAYPKYAVRNDPSMSQEEGTTSNPWPSSDWVAYLSERGLVGFAALALAMLGLALRTLRTLRGAGRDPEGVLAALALVGVLIATVVVGAFDAVLLVAVPTFFVWTLAGALAPSAENGVALGEGATGAVRFATAVVAMVIVARSATQLASIVVYSTTSKLSVQERASTLDPGSYRIHVHLAQGYLGRGDCTHARPHARSAQRLLPSAGEPKRVLSQCGR